MLNVPTWVTLKPKPEEEEPPEEQEEEET